MVLDFQLHQCQHYYCSIMLASKINSIWHFCNFRHYGFDYIFYYQQFFILSTSFHHYYHIFHYNNICIVYIILSDLQVVLFFVCFIVESFVKVFMHCLIVGCIIIYCTILILNILDKMANYIEFRVVEG